jgi:hypothetical protein
LISLNLWAQAQPKAASQVAAPGQNKKSAPLTPQQRTGLNMLQTAEDKAKALPALARAYLLLETCFILHSDQLCQRTKLAPASFSGNPRYRR